MNSLKRDCDIPSLQSVRLTAQPGVKKSLQYDSVTPEKLLNIENKDVLENLSQRLPTPPSHTPDYMVTAENTPIRHLSTNFSDLRCSVSSTQTKSSTQIISPNILSLKDMLTVLQDNTEEVIPRVHNFTKIFKPTLSIQNSQSEYDSPAEGSTEPEQSNIQSEHDERGNKNKDEEIEEQNYSQQMDDKEVRRKSVQLPANFIKRESEEPYKIDIPIKKKITPSMKKKLWREIERRKPFITKNVATHIEKFAKPPFVTWGCKNCNFPYEVKSYSNEYWDQQE